MCRFCFSQFRASRLWQVILFLFSSFLCNWVGSFKYFINFGFGFGFGFGFNFDLLVNSPICLSIKKLKIKQMRCCLLRDLIPCFQDFGKIIKFITIVYSDACKIQGRLCNLQQRFCVLGRIFSQGLDAKSYIRQVLCSSMQAILLSDTHQQLNMQTLNPLQQSNY